MSNVIDFAQRLAVRSWATTPVMMHASPLIQSHHAQTIDALAQGVGVRDDDQGRASAVADMAERLRGILVFAAASAKVIADAAKAAGVDVPPEADAVLHLIESLSQPPAAAVEPEVEAKAKAKK